MVAGGIGGRSATTGGAKSAGQAKVGSTPLSALDVAAACGVPANRSIWGRIGDFFSDVGDTLGFDGSLGFDGTRAARERAALAPYLWPADGEEIVVTAPWQGGTGALAGYVPYSMRPESERTYASAAPPPPPSIGQQLYTTFIGNVGTAYNRRQQIGFAMFDAADANGRQNAQLAPGFDIAFNNVETLGLLAGGAINYVGSPLLAPIDAYVGRPLNTLSGGRIGMEFAGDATVTIGSMFVAPGAGVGRATVVRSGSVGAAEVGATTDLRLALQGATDQAVAELAANPELARGLMSRGSYQHLVDGTNLAGASYGKAVERLTGRIVQADPELSGLFSYQSRPFVSTPDFFGYEGYNLHLFDITTQGQIASHAARPYGSALNYATHPGLPPNLVFPQ
jgi:hypothetical protein